MSSVDNRIVNLTFNNKDFERNAAQSTKTLDGLERSIANTGKSKGLSSFGDAATTVSSKFSAMQVIGVTALATITSKAVSAGLNIVKSLTIAPLVQGFQEYQTNLNSIQTVVSNTGESVSTVNKYMQKLNKYSDQTIYNFSEMARNIGTFTAAGVDLKTATDSIKGIANLAALSGSSSQQASTAMYQLSQAISAGRVGLQDWNSVVNAGMGGKIFQTALARTGVNMGKLAEGAAVLNKETGQLTVNGESFRQSISSVGGGASWLDGVALTETLKQISGAYSEAQLKAKGYTDAQVKDIVKLANTAFNAATKIKTAPQLLQVVQESVGSIFANSFSLILGDFKQSKKLWTTIGATIVGPFGILTKIGNGVTDTLKGWVKLGGRNKMLDGFERAFKNIWRLIVPLKNAFRDIFPADNVSGASRLADFSQAFKDFAEFLKPSVKTMGQLRSVFRGVFAVFHIGFTVVKGIAAAFGEFFSALFQSAGPGRDGILSIAAALGETLVALDKWLTSGGKFMDIMKQIGHLAGSVFSPIIKIVGAAGSAIGGLFSGIGVGGVSGSIEIVKQAILELVSNALGGLERLTAPFQSLSGFFGGLKTKIDGLRDTFSGFTTPIEAGLSRVDTYRQQLGPGFDEIEGRIDATTGKMSGAFDKVTDSTDKARDSVTGMFDAVSGSSGAAATATTDRLSDATDTASSGLERLKELLSNVASGIGNAFSHLGETFGWIRQQFSDLFGNFDGMDWVAFFNAIFSGALILTLRKFASNFGGIGKAIKDTFGELTNTLKSMQQAIKARAIRDIAIAVGILAASMLVLSLLDVKTLGKSLGAVASIMAILVGSLSAMAKISTGNLDILALSTSLTLMSFAMLQLAIAVSVLGRMDVDELSRGLGAMGIALGLMVGAVKTMSGIEGALKSAAFGIVLMAGAMIILAGAVLAFGKMNIKTLAKGLGAMAIGLGLMVGAMLVLSFGGPAITSAASSIVLVSGAMVLLAIAVGRMGKLDMVVLAKGLGAMAIALALVVGAVLLLATAGPAALFGAGAILIIAVALEKIALVIAALGLLPFKVVAGGLAIVAIALAILLAAGAVAMFIAPGLVALGIAVGLLGLGMLLAGAGMALFGAGFAVFAAAGVAGVAVLTVAFHAFLALLPELAVQLAASLVAFLKALANAAPKIRKSVSTIIKNMLGVVVDAIPEIGAVFSALINEGIRILKDSVPRYIDAGLTIIMALLKGVDDHISEVIERASSIVQKLIRGIGDEAGELANAGLDMLVSILEGLTDAVENSNRVREAAGELARTFVDELREMFVELLSHIDLGSMLPDIHIPGLGNILGRNATTGKGGEFIDPWVQLTDKIASASKTLSDVLKSLFDEMTAGYGDKVLAAAKKFVKAQELADKISGKADSSDTSATIAEKLAAGAQNKADKLAKKADKKDATKDDKKDAKDAQKRADKLAKEAAKKRRQAEAQASRADLLQQKADKRAAQLDIEKNVEDAVESGDLEGAGDIRAEEASDLAKRAQEMLAKSKADQDLAEKLAKGNAKERALAEKLRKRAQHEAKLAGEWAQQARDAMDAATNYYRDAAQLRMDEIIAEHNQEALDLAEQQKFDAATTAEKAAIMDARAKASAEEARIAEEKYTAAIAAADAALKAGDVDTANAQLDIAEQQAAIAAQAAQDASDQAAQAAQLADQVRQEAEQAAANGGSSSGGPSNINQPSRTALEDAARAVDRHTQSLTDAETAAAASQPVLQFVQTNTSPTALTASEIYRQTSNLLSLAQTKIGQ